MEKDKLIFNSGYKIALVIPDYATAEVKHNKIIFHCSCLMDLEQFKNKLESMVSHLERVIEDERK